MVKALLAINAIYMLPGWFWFIEGALFGSFILHIATGVNYPVWFFFLRFPLDIFTGFMLVRAWWQAWKDDAWPNTGS